MIRPLFFFQKKQYTIHKEWWAMLKRLKRRLLRQLNGIMNKKKIA